jgi:hypothetical protein
MIAVLCRWCVLKRFLAGGAGAGVMDNAILPVSRLFYSTIRLFTF